MQEKSSPILRLGTRGSLLARAQSQLVADELQRLHEGLRVERLVFKTSGDQIADRPLYELGGKGLFTRELEEALLAGEIDFAVHSFKDVPVTMPLVDPSGLIVAAVPVREDPRDVLVSVGAKPLAGLSRGARVGTESLRRRCQLLDARPDLAIETIRGNIDTRLRKLFAADFDAIVLALAGVRRAGLFDPATMCVLERAQMLPAAGQGALALQCRRGDSATIRLLGALNDADSAVCVEAERALVAELRGDCHSPIAALARIEGAGAGATRRMTLEAAIGGRDGRPPVLRANATGDVAAPVSLARAVFRSLAEQGVEDLLRPAP